MVIGKVQSDVRSEPHGYHPEGKPREHDGRGGHVETHGFHACSSIALHVVQVTRLKQDIASWSLIPARNSQMTAVSPLRTVDILAGRLGRLATSSFEW